MTRYKNVLRINGSTMNWPQRAVVYSDLTCNIVVIWVKIFKTEKTIEIHLVRLTEVCGKALSEKYANKSVKTALLLSNVIDTDHQNSCLQTKAIFHYIYGF